jgi:hypothetical protein
VDGLVKAWKLQSVLVLNNITHLLVLYSHFLYIKIYTLLTTWPTVKYPIKSTTKNPKCDNGKSVNPMISPITVKGTAIPMAEFTTVEQITGNDDIS